MQTTWFAKSVAASLRFSRQACGLALVLAACSGTAFASPPPLGAPEIDPGSMGSAVALLTGGILLVADRFRRRSR